MRKAYAIGIVAFLCLLTVPPLRAQIDIIRIQNAGGTVVATYAAPFIIKCSTNLACTPGAGNILTVTASSTAATAWGAITTDTNTIATMLIGTGASMGVTGTGTNQANRLTPAGTSGNMVLWGVGGAISATDIPPPANTTVTASQFFTSYTAATGVFGKAQPALSDFSGTLPVIQGGTGLTAGTSGGIPYFSGPTTIASSAALTINQLVLGGGTGASPTVLTTGTTATLLHGNASGAPSWGQVSLTAEVTGNLPITNLNSGTNASSSTFWRGDATWAASGSITSIGTTGPISGGPITSTGTISCPTCTSNSATLTGGQLVLGAGANTVAVGNLSGDVTTSGSAATVVGKVNGVAYPTTGASFDAIPVLISNNTVNYYQVNGGSDCGDATHALKYTQTTHLFACQAITATAAPAGSDTQLQTNDMGALGASANLTWVSPALSIGATGSATGVLKLVGTTSGTVSVQTQAAAGTYNFNLPTSAGASGAPLVSGGGGGTAMSFSTLTVGGGGTGLTSGTSGGIPYFSSPSAITSSGTLTANAVVLGGGVGTSPGLVSGLGTTVQVLHGNAGGAPTWATLTLTTDVSGILPGANGGTGNGFFAVTGPTTSLKTFTLPNASATILTDNALVTAAQGGTANGFFAVSGPAASTKTFTFPNASATVLTSNAAVTVAQGGTGAATFTANGVLYGNTTSAIQVTAAGGVGTILETNGAPSPTAAPVLGTAGTQGSLGISGTTSGTVTLTTAAVAGTWTFTVPTSGGSNGQFLQTNGSGTTSWASPAGSGTVSSGTTNQIAKYTASTTVGNSLLSDDGTTLTYTGTGGISSSATGAGYLQLTQGSAPSLGTTAIQIVAPNPVTSYQIILAGTAATGIPHYANSANTITETISAISLTADVSGTLPVANGGTGRTTLTNHGVLVGATTTAITQLAAAAAGTLLTGQGAAADPSFSATPTLGIAGSVTGTLALAGSNSGAVTVQPANAAGTWSMTLPTSGGTNGQFLQTNGSGVTAWATPAGTGTVNIGTASRLAYYAGNGNAVVDSGAALTWVAPTLSVGQAGTGTGQIKMLGTTSGTITIQSQDAAGTYNFNLPTTAGSAGQVLTSQGGGSSAMTWSAAGGVTSVAQTFTGGLISVAGSPITTSGTLALTVAGTSGGIPYFDSATSWASSGALAAGQFVLGGGAAAAPTTSFSIVPSANGGTGMAFFTVAGPASTAKTFTFPNANATVLTDAAAVSVAQGGIGVGTLAAHGVLIGAATSAVLASSPGAADTIFMAADAGVGSDPAFKAGPGTCSAGGEAVTYNTGTHAWGCHSIAGSGTVDAGLTGQLAYYPGNSNEVDGSINTSLTNGALTLGVANTTIGQLLLEGNTSGVVTLTPQAAAGTPTITFGTSSGTPAVTASAPLSITTATGNITCTTCAVGPGSATTHALASWNGTGGLTLESLTTQWTVSATTLTSGATGVLDLSAASTTAGLKIPAAAGAIPTADDFIATNTTNHTFVWGSNGTTMVGAIAATGTGTITSCTNQFVTSVSSLVVPTCGTVTLAGAQFANQGTTTTLLHGNGAGNPSWGAVVNADININATTCSNQFVTVISATVVGTCTTATLASAQFANQGTTTTILHGNGGGNPSWSAVVSADLNITTTTCTNTFVISITSGGVGSCGVTFAGLTSSTANPATSGAIRLANTDLIAWRNGANSNILYLTIDTDGLSFIDPLSGNGGIKAPLFRSTVLTGTAPFVVSSTTNVANLNASSLSGATFAAPGAIGGGTPSTGAFTTMTATSLLATGLVDGTAPVIVTTGTTGTPGATYNHSYSFNQHATPGTAVTYTLPTAAAGKQYCVANDYGGAADTGVLTVATSAAGQFIVFTDGTLSATGGNVTSGGAAADAACFVGIDATHWHMFVQSGTWTKH